MKALSPTPWYWSEDQFHGGLFGLFDAEDQDVLVPMTQNEGDTGAAWFEEHGDRDDFKVIAASGSLYERMVEIYELAMTGLPLSDMTPDDWNRHKLFRIEAMARTVLDQVEKMEMP